MTKRERVLNAFHNQAVDKLPMGFWYHFSPDDDFGQQTVEEHLRLYRDTDMDFIKVMCDGYFNYPNPFIETVNSADDWFRMTPMGENSPYIRRQVERAKAVVNAVGKECCVFYNVFCPMSLMRFGTNEDILMGHLKRNELAVCHAFEVIAEVSKRWSGC